MWDIHFEMLYPATGFLMQVESSYVRCICLKQGRRRGWGWKYNNDSPHWRDKNCISTTQILQDHSIPECGIVYPTLQRSVLSIFPQHSGLSSNRVPDRTLRTLLPSSFYFSLVLNYQFISFPTVKISPFCHPFHALFSKSLYTTSYAIEVTSIVPGQTSMSSH